jgi:predicted CoA-binding protein
VGAGALRLDWALQGAGVETTGAGTVDGVVFQQASPLISKMATITLEKGAGIMSEMREDRYEQLVEEFFGKKRIAIWGVEDARSDPGRWVAGKIRKRGIEVIAVNPTFADGESRDRASSLTKIDPPAEAVLVYVDRPQTMEAVDDCLAAGTPLVWLHDALSPGAATPEAIDKLRAAGRAVIPGLCPMFYLKPVDPAHFCLKWLLRLSGKEKRTRQAAGATGPA